jgi:hypothetical protein
VQLLSDLFDVFGGDEKLPTETILHRLHNLPESPWTDIRGKPLDDRGLAVRLRKYGVKPKVLRIGDSTPRGYTAADLHDAWKRYVPAFQGAQQAQQCNMQQSSTRSETQNPAEKSERLAHVADVADVAAFHGGGPALVHGADLDAAYELEERAAILEYDGGLPRDEAEKRSLDGWPEMPAFLNRRARQSFGTV